MTETNLQEDEKRQKIEAMKEKLRQEEMRKKEEAEILEQAKKELEQEKENKKPKTKYQLAAEEQRRKLEEKLAAMTPEERAKWEKRNFFKNCFTIIVIFGLIIWGIGSLGNGNGSSGGRYAPTSDEDNYYDYKVCMDNVRSMHSSKQYEQYKICRNMLEYLKK